MYPTVVILLVETHRSMMDICDISPSNASKFTGPALASEARPATFMTPVLQVCGRASPQYDRPFGS